MKFRKATISDVTDILKIINSAQTSLKNSGVDQWQNGYPNIKTIENDIFNQNSYVLLQHNKIIATLMLSFEKEKTYDTIYNGKWLSTNDYAVIHRIAVDNNFKRLGVASTIIKYIEKICLENSLHSLKIDTHRDNLSMQKLLEKNKFKYCGIIYLEDKSERIAFEKII